MSRKAAHGAQAISLVITQTEPAPSTVADRKRARRAPKAKAAATPAPVYVKPSIDLTQPDAKKALAAAFPVVVEGKYVQATEAEEIAALAYFEARDAAARAEGAKEAAGNVLRYAIADAEGITGDGWKATWKHQKSEIDWGALVKELAIESEVIERFRKPKTRVLLPKEVTK